MIIQSPKKDKFQAEVQFVVFKVGRHAGEHLAKALIRQIGQHPDQVDLLIEIFTF